MLPAIPKNRSARNKHRMYHEKSIKIEQNNAPPESASESVQIDHKIHDDRDAGRRIMGGRIKGTEF